MTKLVVYLFINQSLKMDKGKIAAQTVHAINGLHRGIGNEHINVMDRFQSYIYGGNMNVCIAYKANLQQMEEIYATYGGYIVTDAGLTQVAPGSKTVLALYPRVKSEEFKSFKLL